MLTKIKIFLVIILIKVEISSVDSGGASCNKNHYHNTLYIDLIIKVGN